MISKEKEHATHLLHIIYGEKASFREGQLEAIVSVLSNKKTIVVQKTGWGKSLVYFIATKILRNKGLGPTILISPLLSLMRNQIYSANKLGLHAYLLNSTNQSEWNNVYNKLNNNECDILMISPERLGNKECMDNILSNIKQGIGLFVIDEAHCISEWGHDFRPDFLRINNFIKTFPNNIPILATTATANNRVIEDINTQFGDNLTIQRGPLIRESLRIQVIKLNKQEERLAWLVENINKMDGAGIVYCLTQRDCDLVSEWLNQNGINSQKYYSDKSIDRLKVEDDFYNNRFKVIVATVALGMGYDKPDIKFVIHYQRPGSMLAYYQQIGRAGRQLDEAYAIMLVGEEDDKIQEYFINTAFPNEKELSKVLISIEEEDKINKREICKKVNLKVNKIEQCLKFLDIMNLITKEGSDYYRTTNLWNINIEEKEKITRERIKELNEIQEYTEIQSCYMEFISKSLDDPFICKCGKCANCTEPLFNTFVKESNLLRKARQYIKNNVVIIEPRKQYPNGTKIPVNLRNEIGFALCSYGDYGWGELVRQGKYDDNYFSEKLVKASYQILKRQKLEKEIECIVYVPSITRPSLVKDFAHKLALLFKIPCYNAIEKIKQTPPQKSMENSALQYENVTNCFKINENIDLKEKSVLLVDDMVDSKWTFTVCGIILKEAGVKYVYPYALASTAGRD